MRFAAIVDMAGGSNRLILDYQDVVHMRARRHDGIILDVQAGTVSWAIRRAWARKIASAPDVGENRGFPRNPAAVFRTGTCIGSALATVQTDSDRIWTRGADPLVRASTSQGATSGAPAHGYMGNAGMGRSRDRSCTAPPRPLDFFC